MNKLITTFNAGIGFEWDDFRFEQAAVRDAFYALLSAFGITPDQSFIISGCTVSGVAPTQSYAPGYIALNGEILFVPGGALPVVVNPGDFLYWDIDVSYDPAGFEMFENGTSGDTYQVRTASVKVGQPSTYMPFAADVLPQRISRLALNFLPALNWTVNAFKLLFPVGSAPVGEPSVAIGYQSTGFVPAYKIDSAGNIHFTGQVQCNVGTSPQVLINLPQSLWPTRPCATLATVYDTAGHYDRVVPLIVRQGLGVWEIGFPWADPVSIANGEFIDFGISYQKA